MLNYLLRRILLIPITLIGATALVFLVIALSPGSVVSTLLSNDGSMRPAERKAREEYLKTRFGLGQPPHIQYLRWLNNLSPVGFTQTPEGKLANFTVKKPDLGHSFARGRPVAELVAEALPVTLSLQIVALPLAYLVAVLTGIFAARFRGGTFDTLSGTLFLGMWSLPVIWVGVMLIGFFANSLYFNWFPANGLNKLEAYDMTFLPGFDEQGGWVRGFFLDRVWHMVLPVICLTYTNFAFLSKLTRGALLETISADFVRTARAKGLSERVVLFRHAFRNSLIPLITVGASLFVALISGSVVVETIFGINGMGKLFVDAAFQKDQELLLTLIGLTTLLSVFGTLLADFANVLADPRVSYE
jgi:peptide/nickel transport system permease protein